MQKFINNSLAQYRLRTPTLNKVEDLLELGRYTPDHIAFRTFKCIGGINIFAKQLKNEYEVMDSYDFPSKKLTAKWFKPMHKDSGFPRIFVSQLEDDLLPLVCQRIITQNVNNMHYYVDLNDNFNLSDEYQKKFMRLSFSDYEILRKESEYGAWLLVNGNRINHIAININDIIKVNNLNELHQILEGNGIELLEVGNKIKTSKDGLLHQSSIKSDKSDVTFVNPIQEIEVTGAFVEFIHRENGREGFEADNALHIFESTTVTKSKD